MSAFFRKINFLPSFTILNGLLLLCLLMSSQRSSSYDSPFFILCNITSVEIDQNTFLVSPSYGLCLWQIPADASSPFSGKPLGLPKKMSPHTAGATTERQNTWTK